MLFAIPTFKKNIYLFIYLFLTVYVLHSLKQILKNTKIKHGRH